MTTPQHASTTHVVIATYGTAGDMYPFLRLATALKQRGHQVSVLAPDMHEALVVQAGIAFRPFGSRAEYLTAIEDPDLWHPRKGFEVVWASTRGHLRALHDFVATLPSQEPCLLIAHPLMLPMAALARVPRPELRIVGAYLAPGNLRTVHNPLTMGPLRIPAWVPLSLRRRLWAAIDRRMIDPVAVPDINRERRNMGLPEVSNLFAHMGSVADLSLTLFPSWFAPHAPDWPQPMVVGDFTLYDPNPTHALSPELQAFLDAGPAPVVFTPGSAQQHAARYFVDALRVAQRLKQRAVLLTSHREQVPEVLPSGVIWQAYAPLHALLPRVAALVHHGGIGTAAEALRAGVPQVVAPMAHDQFDNAARIEALGVGRVVSPGRAWARALAAALRHSLTSPTVHERCQATAARFGPEPNLLPVYQAIESLLDAATSSPTANPT